MKFLIGDSLLLGNKTNSFYDTRFITIASRFDFIPTIEPTLLRFVKAVRK